MESVNTYILAKSRYVLY